MEFNVKMDRLPVALLQANDGSLPGVPENPRKWNEEELQLLADSIEETPELLEARPVIVVPYDGAFVVLGGNMRLAAAQRLGWETVPCAIYPEDTPASKCREIVQKDNGSFGRWDFDKLAADWQGTPTREWGVPSWNTPAQPEEPADEIEIREQEIDTDSFDDKQVMKFTFNAEEWLHVSSTLQALDKNKENALLKLCGYGTEQN